MYIYIYIFTKIKYINLIYTYICIHLKLYNLRKDIVLN